MDCQLRDIFAGEFGPCCETDIPIVVLADVRIQISTHRIFFSLSTHTKEGFLRVSSNDLSYTLICCYIPPRCLPLANLRCSILRKGKSKELVPVTETPHYKFLCGDVRGYTDYIDAHIGKEVQRCRFILPRPDLLYCRLMTIIPRKTLRV